MMCTRFHHVFNNSILLKALQSKLFSTLANEISSQTNNGLCSKNIHKLKITLPEENSRIPIYQVLDKSGEIIELSEEPKLDNDTLVSMYKCMTQLNVMDKVLYESQRQGRISFYMTNTGEEACQVGSSAALPHEDLIYGQYREVGVLMWRGFSLSNMMNQCYGNCEDVGKGKQMPVHYGSKDCNFVTISSPLSTQIPQAVGSAYAFKRENKGRCVAVYFGEGAASEGDAHAAFNFAAVLDTPLIFICRNNGYAISTGRNEQYRGDGIADRGLGYGIPALRVDGNDILAVYNATRAARHFATTNSRPIILEFITYRLGHHSTSDDSTAYRSIEEVTVWEDMNPIKRFKCYLQNKDLWNENIEKEWLQTARKMVLEAFNKAEKVPKPDWREMFTDVNWAMPKNLMKQREYLSNHLAKYKDHYPINSYKNS